MSTKITSPIEGYDGRSVFGPTTLTFKAGVAEVDEKIPDGLRAYLEGRGYTLETSVDVPDGAPTESWTVPQLTAWAKAHGVDLAGAKTKAEVVAAVVPKRDGEPPQDPPAGGQGDDGQQGGGDGQ